MRYQSTTDLPAEIILEIIARIHQVTHGRGIDFTRHRLTLYMECPAFRGLEYCGGLAYSGRQVLF